MSKSNKEFEELVKQTKKDYDLDALIIAGIADDAEHRLCGMTGAGDDLLVTICLIILQLSQALNTTPTKLAKKIADAITAEEITNTKPDEELKDLLKEVFENED